MTRQREPQEGLGAAVKKLRERRGTTQAELASQSGVSQASISLIETGSGNPTWTNVQKLADALQVSITELAREAARLEKG